MSKLAKLYSRAAVERGFVHLLTSTRRKKSDHLKETYTQYLELEQNPFHRFVWLVAVILAIGTLLIGLMMITQIRTLDKKIIDKNEMHALGKG